MVNLFEVCELAWRQIFPSPNASPSISKEEFIATGKTEFAYQQLLMAWKEQADYGEFEVPPYLITEVEKDIVNNEMDISDLKYFNSLPQQVWLRNIGGINCKCKYVKSTDNLSQLLCGDDSLDDTARTYYVMSRKIKFPLGTHANKLTILYANIGENLDGNIDIDEALGALVRDKLNAVYLGKVAQSDVTNNNNPND